MAAGVLGCYGNNINKYISYSFKARNIIFDMLYPCREMKQMGDFGCSGNYFLNCHGNRLKMAYYVIYIVLITP